MPEITGDMKVADVVRRWPQTDDVFSRRGCQDVRQGFMARILTVRNAARLGGIDPASLLDELNRAAAAAGPRQA